MKRPLILSPQEWDQARQEMLVEEKAMTRARDALAAKRRRMPWMEVTKQYEFEGPNGRLRLLDLFEGRQQRSRCDIVDDRRKNSNALVRRVRHFYPRMQLHSRLTKPSVEHSSATELLRRSR